ncbi:MAG: NFACT RNA binding domain-containing protein, partial [Spirochaetaceae bacterium]|nr:NFACT RNA binding domain-containing protein [Spirochaetaceae bacterium]
LVDGDGMVVDALARRPKKGEVSGERCTIEDDLARARAARTAPGAPLTGAPLTGAPPERSFEIRELSGEGSYNEKVEAHYAQTGGALSREKLLESARERFARKSRAVALRLAELEAKATDFRDSERLRELGDLLMSCPDGPYDGKYARCEDFFRGGEIRIPVDPNRSRVENARAYYDRGKKARSGLGEIEAQISATRASLVRAERELAELEATADPFLIARAMAKGGAAREELAGAPKERSYPGLSLERSGWTILVGRSAKENDELLRSRVRGSDLWLHARDWPGSYVFIKARKGKSVPLDLLLDAGMLAIHYSKGRSNGGGDLYYTFVKYLRRAKDGPKGTVIPTQEKNLSVKIDDKRIKELRALIGDQD